MSSIAAPALHIRTPEGVTFALPLASPFSRLLAWLIDAIVILGITIAMAQVTSLVQLLSSDLARTVVTLSYFVISVGYGMLLEWRWRGQTIGKRVLRLRVIDASGLRLQPVQVVLRNLLRFIDSLPLLYLVGGISTVLTAHAQRLGDLIANTVVIRSDTVPPPNWRQLSPLRFNSLAAAPVLAARLRQRITPAAAGLAVEALLRRDDLTPAHRLDLFAALATYYRHLVEFPPELTESLSDEQYIRNVVAILYQ